MTTRRLSLATLGEVLNRGGVQGPQPAPGDVTAGIAHLGIGAFHRAHQASYTADAMAAAGATDWGIVGVTQRSATVRNQLVPQDGLYTLWEKGAGAAEPHIMGLHKDVLAGADDPGAVVDLLARPEIRIVTLTVTEKGYRMGAGRRLNLDDDVIRADLAGALAAGTPRSSVGQLVAGLVRRAAIGAPLTVLTCDNLPENGRVLGGLVRELAEAARVGDAVLAFIEASVTFPCSMVDRIVPATTEGDRADAAALLGVEDQGLVVAEPFRQWVIEDTFAAGRPAWDAVGATLTDDVAPWENAKLRLLNGSHSLLAYAGALAGYPTIASAVHDEQLRRYVVELQADSAATLQVPDGLDVDAYRASLLERFGNPALPHTTIQVAMDGSQKLPQRLVHPAVESLAAGRTPHGLLRAIAAWMAFVALGRDTNGEVLPLDDPLAEQLRQAAGDGRAASAVRGLLAVDEVFGGSGLADRADVVAELTDGVRSFGVPA